MTMAAGTECYVANVSPVTARGVAYSDRELDDALGESVAPILWDDAGTENLDAILTSIVTTEFSEASIKRVLSSQHTPENWRVGEGLAEAFLTEHRSCEFPWPSGRDLRNPSSSPAGTDLVGFQKIDDIAGSHRFTFGEVKTSEQEAWPPSVVTGRHGLIKQLEALKTSADIKDNLVKYLGHHAQGADWIDRFQCAAKRYLANPSDVSLFGVLVRDVEPKPEDLSKRAVDLASGCPTETSIELRAMYLPRTTIGTLAQRIVRIRETDNGNN